MKKTILSLAIIASLASCKKDAAAPVNTCKASAASIAGSYKITSVMYKETATGTPADMLSVLPPCQQDDLLNLNTAGDVTFSDAGVSCGLPPAPGSFTNWTLESENTVLKMGDSPMKIQSFDCKTLVLVETSVNTDGDVRTTTLTKQ